MTDSYLPHSFPPFPYMRNKFPKGDDFKYLTQTDTDRHRQTDRQTDRMTDRQTDRQTDTDRYRQIQRQTEREKQREV